MLVEASIPRSFCCKRESWPTSSHAGSNAESSSNAMSKFGIPQLNIESVFLQAGTSLAHTHKQKSHHLYTYITYTQTTSPYTHYTSFTDLRMLLRGLGVGGSGFRGFGHTNRCSQARIPGNGVSGLGFSETLCR